jgi:NitT/TauT family transport system permease protein
MHFKSTVLLHPASGKTCVLFYIWLGPSQSINAMSLAISLFVTILVIYSGFKGVEVNQIKLARTFGASKAQILTRVILPGSIPTTIAALKVSAGLWRHRAERFVSRWR